jgi:hypothetical protein
MTESLTSRMIITQLSNTLSWTARQTDMKTLPEKRHQIVINQSYKIITKNKYFKASLVVCYHSRYLDQYVATFEITEKSPLSWFHSLQRTHGVKHNAAQPLD